MLLRDVDEDLEVWIPKSCCHEISLPTLRLYLTENNKYNTDHLHYEELFLHLSLLE